MKKIITMIAVIVLSCTALNAQAGNTGKSTAIGAVSGAAIGQAIGRNTEATLIGITVGGVAGYIVGNEMDKNGYVRPVRVVRAEPSYPVQQHVIVVVEPTRQRHHPHTKWMKNNHNNRNHNKWKKHYNHRARHHHHPDWRHERQKQHRMIW